MKSTTFALGSLLATVAIAQPHRHQHFHQKRDEVVELTTEWVAVYETELVTTTIWVTAGQPAATDAEASPTPVPAQFFEPKGTVAVVTVVATATEAPAPSAEAPEAPATTPAAAAPVVEASVAAVPEVESSTPVAAPVVAEVTTAVNIPVVEETTPVVASTVAPVVAAVSTPVASVAASAASTVDTSATGSSSGSCTGASDLCGGDLTYYDPVMESWGSCGWHNDGLTEKVVALPVGLMGAQSNGNPYCGKYITILHNGKSTVAKVVDKCMGCTGRAIDISRFAFDDLDDQAVGRTTATWYFN